MRKVYIVKVDNDEFWFDRPDEATTHFIEELEEREEGFNALKIDEEYNPRVYDTIKFTMRIVTEEEYQEIMSAED